MSALPPISPLTSKFFLAYARRHLRKHFHATRLLDSHSPAFPSGPLIVFTNHASWWDPLACFVFARHFLPGRNHYGPIDARALERYPIFKKLGFFAVPRDQSGTAAARSFLSQTKPILADENAVLWLTPQGAFVDPRQRPLTFEAGLAHLIRKYPHIPAFPLALEYPFWEERTPELLAAFGNPIAPDQPPEQALTDLQDTLAQAAIAKDPSRFKTLLGGSGGAGGIYDRWRKLASRLTGKEFVKEHSAIATK